MHVIGNYSVEHIPAYISGYTQSVIPEVYRVLRKGYVAFAGKTLKEAMDYISSKCD